MKNTHKLYKSGKYLVTCLIVSSFMYTISLEISSLSNNNVSAAVTGESNYPNTNGQTLVGSGYDKLETRDLAQQSINCTIFIHLIRRHFRYACDYKN